MIALIDADSFIYIIGWYNKDNPSDLTKVYAECDSMLNNILDTVVAESYVGVFSDDNTFRHIEYAQAPYKGTRAEKPDWVRVLEPIIKDYFITKYGFYQAKGLEADDIVCALHRDGTVICSPDKDLRQKHGANFDYKKNQYALIGFDEAWNNLYTQMLTGDKGDNVIGIPGVGPVKAYQMLAVCTTKEEAEMIVKAQYKFFFKDNWETIYNNTFNTIKMLDEEHHYWLSELPLVGLCGRDYVMQFEVVQKPKADDSNEEFFKELGW